jgi:hypothetical protein
MAKIRVPAMLSVVALTLCALPLISLAPVGRAGATDDPSPATNAIADAEGELRVPADYRSMYEYLGSWAIAAPETNEVVGIHLDLRISRF